MKVVYLYDGTPYLAELNEEGEYNYPKEAWTETPPPEGIYEPFYFNGNEWVGTSKEEWESNQVKPPMEPKALEMLVSQLQLQVMIGNKKTKELEDKLEATNKTLADALLKITEIENKIGGNA
ncbi:hypothetical protein EKQ61_01350 [Staphylococcus gallinarum]|uniref:Phage protein n=1 Tax=Staphylococcus gallinarum TaxID=1293 RepID=A0A380FIS9_STAGA|nr:hypothetical protein [Staphylococcus gallinarum]RTX82921.1 hypothetical protein EKQ61_01350 [Staphylococcus gallinarum]GEQ07024.1 hypothetical protein SGA02_28520 [Staphylococcus gallinarum]SUM34018.1 Uncharacterised protein [Staphylococcus gallinarum]